LAAFLTGFLAAFLAIAFFFARKSNSSSSSSSPND